MKAKFNKTAAIINRVSEITIKCGECFADKRWPPNSIIEGEEINLCECVEREFKEGDRG